MNARCTISILIALAWPVYGQTSGPSTRPARSTFSINALAEGERLRVTVTATGCFHYEQYCLVIDRASVAVIQADGHLRGPSVAGTADLTAEDRDRLHSLNMYYARHEELSERGGYTGASTEHRHVVIDVIDSEGSVCRTWRIEDSSAAYYDRPDLLTFEQLARGVLGHERK